MLICGTNAAFRARSFMKAGKVNTESCKASQTLFLRRAELLIYQVTWVRRRMKLQNGANKFLVSPPLHCPNEWRNYCSIMTLHSRSD